MLAADKGSSAVDAPQPRVAVVDDDESVRESLVGLMESMGFDVAFFTSAEDFLTRSRSERIACLILDVRLPGISGVDLYRRLLATNSRIPTIFVTALQDRSIERRAMEAGALAFLYKPFKPEALLLAVKKAIGKPALRNGVKITWGGKPK